MSKVLFIGSNPSQKSSSIVPFWHDTNSSKVLYKWLDLVQADSELYLESLLFLNVSNLPTPGNRPLKISEIKSNLDSLKNSIETLRPDKIIAVGKAAEKALTLLRLDFYAMPHPSGLNRKLNDPKYIEEKINGLKIYLSPPK